MKCFSLVSHVQDYIKYITENLEALPTKSRIYIYINLINNRLVLKKKMDIIKNHKRQKQSNYLAAQKN